MELGIAGFDCLRRFSEILAVPKCVAVFAWYLYQCVGWRFDESTCNWFRSFRRSALAGSVVEVLY